MKTILITGTAGFIGYHLARNLLELGDCRIVGYDNHCDYYPATIKTARVDALRQYGDAYQHCENDLCDIRTLRIVFEDLQPTVVCNLAAQAGVRYSIANPFAYQVSNMEGFLNILECCRHYPVDRLVYASSSSVYGGNTKLPFTEDDRVDTPISFYAVTKKSNELTAHSYSHLYGIRTVGLRFFTVYGPWGRPDMAMWIFAEKISHNEPIPVFNHGKMKRDFTYIDDIVSGVTSALFTEELGVCEIFNLGNHRCENLMEMIGILESALEKKAQLNYLPMQPGDVPATYADINRAQTKLGFSPKTPISKGIPIFCEWYRQQSQLAREIREWRMSSQES